MAKKDERDIILDKDALINKNIFLKEYTNSEASYNEFINTIEEQFFTHKIKLDDDRKVINGELLVPPPEAAAAAAKTTAEAAAAEPAAAEAAKKAAAAAAQNYIVEVKKYIKTQYDKLKNLYEIFTKIKKENGDFKLDIANVSGAATAEIKNLAISQSDYDKLTKPPEKTKEQYQLFINNFEDFVKVVVEGEAAKAYIVIDKSKFTPDIFYARIIGGYNTMSSQIARELDKYKQRYLSSFIKTKQSLEDLVERSNPLRVNYYKTYNATEYTRETIKAIKKALRQMEAKMKKETDDKKLLLLNVIRAFQLSPDDKYTINRLNSFMIGNDGSKINIPTPQSGGAGDAKIIPDYLQTLRDWLKGYMSEDDYKKLTNYISEPSEALLEQLKNLSPNYQQQKIQDFQAMALSIQDAMRLIVENINKTFEKIQMTEPKAETIESEIVSVMKILVDKLNGTLQIAKESKEQSLELHIKESIDNLVAQLTTLIRKIEPEAQRQDTGEIEISQDIGTTLGLLTNTLNDILGVIQKVSEEADITADIQNTLNSLITHFTTAITNIETKELTSLVANVQAGIDLLKTTEISETLSNFANQLDKLLQSTLIGSVEFLVHHDIVEVLERLYEYISKLDKSEADKKAPLKQILEEVKQKASEPFDATKIGEILGKQTDAIVGLSVLLATIQDKLTPEPTETIVTEADAAREADVGDAAEGAAAEANGELRGAVEPDDILLNVPPAVEAEAASGEKGPVVEAAPGAPEAEETSVSGTSLARITTPEIDKLGRLNPLSALPPDGSRPTTALRPVPMPVAAWPELAAEATTKPLVRPVAVPVLEQGNERWAEYVVKVEADVAIINSILDARLSDINDFHEIIQKLNSAKVLGKYIIGAFIIANIVESRNSPDQNLYTLTLKGIDVFKEKLKIFKTSENINDKIESFKSINVSYLDKEYTILNNKIYLQGKDRQQIIYLNSIFKGIFNTSYDITFYTWRQLLENILNDTPLESYLLQRRMSFSGGNILTDGLDSMDGGAPITTPTGQALTPEKIKEMKEKIITFAKSISGLKENIKNIQSKFNAYTEAAPIKGFDEISVNDDELKLLNTFFSTVYPKIEAYNNIKGPQKKDILQQYEIIGYSQLLLKKNNDEAVLSYIQTLNITNDTVKNDAIKALGESVQAAAEAAKAKDEAAEAAKAKDDAAKAKDEAAKAKEKEAAKAKELAKEKINILLKELVKDIINQAYPNQKELIDSLNKIPSEQKDFIADINTLIETPEKVISKFTAFKNKGNLYSSDEYIALTDYFKKNGDVLKKDIIAEAEKIKATLQQNYNDIFTILKPFESKQWFKDFKQNLLNLLENNITNTINNIVRDIIQDIDTLSSRIQQKAQIAEKIAKERFEKAKLEQKEKEYKAQKEAEQARGQAEAAARAQRVGGGGQVSDVNRKNIKDTIESISIDIGKVVEEFTRVEKKITNISDPATSLALSGDRSIFNALYNKYLESKQRGDVGGDMRATEELMESLEANQLVPRTVLAINMRDKIIFIFATLFIRLFSLSVIEFMIEKGAIKNSNFAILGYLGLFTLVFIAFTLLVNLDMYRLRIVFNYINFHANAANVYTYLALLWVFGGVIYYVTYYLNKDAPLLNTTDETKVRLIYRIQVISLIIWLFLVLMVSIL